MLRNKEEMKIEYQIWKYNTEADSELQKQLFDMVSNEKEQLDAFYKDLEFGTGGLRGIMGAGTNRMNIYTVSKATRGVAAYIMNHFPKDKQSVAIGYDSRLNSIKFSKKAAEIFASLGIRVFIFSELMPTPMLSWAVRNLKCSAGIMITASHNSAEYNGYKVYESNGCQITNEIAKKILKEMENFCFFEKGNICTYNDGLENGIIKLIGDEIIDGFIDTVKSQSLLNASIEVRKGLSIVYTPLNGTGLKPITRVLKESGYSNVFVVPEQEYPNGNFPTCPIPNPEEKETLNLGLEYAKKLQADILLATDPDCDRVGVVVADERGSTFVRLSGNEVGVLLLDYICKKRVENGSMPRDPVIMKSIVTTELAERIADSYGIRTINLLTGFKYIGEQINVLEQNGGIRNFLLGFEESCGYLSGTYVRDKDGVGAALLICEMAAYYKNKGKTLNRVLESIYQKYGYFSNTLHTYQFKGKQGRISIISIMKRIRKFCVENSGVNMPEGGINRIGDRKSIDFILVEDYLLKYKKEYNKNIESIKNIPETDMIKIVLDNNCHVIIRPSGTEPKIKIYVEVRAADKAKVTNIERIIVEKIELLLNRYTGKM